MIYLELLAMGFSVTIGMELALGLCFAIRAVITKGGKKK